MFWRVALSSPRAFLVHRRAVVGRLAGIITTLLSAE